MSDEGITPLDETSEKVLRFLVEKDAQNDALSQRELAKIFTSEYCITGYVKPLRALRHLEQVKLVSVRWNQTKVYDDREELPQFIDLTQLGSSYFERLSKSVIANKDKMRRERRWSTLQLIIGILLTALVSVIGTVIFEIIKKSYFGEG